MVNKELTRRVCITGLRKKATVKNLKIYFCKYGNIENFYIRKYRGRNIYAVVTFSSGKKARRALNAKHENQDLFRSVRHPYLWHKYKMFKVCKKENLNDKYVEDCPQNNFINMSIYMLNDDCLMHIFSFLPIVDKIRIERVCKSWKILSQKSWHTMTTLNVLPATWGIRRSKITSFMLKKALLKCGQFLRKIYIPGIAIYSAKIELGDFGSCPNITNIDVSGVYTTSLGIQLLTNNCRNITKLSLGRPRSKQGFEDDLIKLFEIHQNLEYLSLNMFELSSRCLLHLPEQKLHTIKFDDCDFLMRNEKLSTALRRLKNLKCLEINFCGFRIGMVNAINKYCTTLRVLQLNLHPNVIKKLYFTNLTNLQVITIPMCISLSDTHLIDMVSNCKQLTSIDIRGDPFVTDAGLQVISSLPKLEKLVVDCIHDITNHGIMYLHDLKKLQCRGLWRITDEGISSIIMSSPQLQLLDLSGCINITDATLTVAKEVCNNRSNNVKLTIIIGGTSLSSSYLEGETVQISPFLELKNVKKTMVKLRIPKVYHNVYIDSD